MIKESFHGVSRRVFGVQVSKGCSDLWTDQRWGGGYCPKTLKGFSELEKSLRCKKIYGLPGLINVVGRIEFLSLLYTPEAAV